MAMTNHERVGKALEILKTGLAPFVEREMKMLNNDRKGTQMTNEKDNRYPSISGIRVLVIGQSFNLPYTIKHLQETAHLRETFATFRPDVIITSTFIPGELSRATHELRKRWINVPENADIPSIIIAVENTYRFNLWTEHQHQKDNPIVSVYTPTCNTGDYLPDTFESLRSQTYANWEWVVLDDASSDKTWSRLQEYASQDYRIRPFQSGVHLGKIGATKELATRLCRGKYLVELDHDDMLTDTALEEVKNAFEANPHVGMVYTNSASFFENGNPQRFPEGEPWTQPDRYREVEYHGKKYLECRNPDIYDRFGPHFTQVFGWFLTVGPHHIRSFRAETFWKLGGYNPELPVADDFDLFARFFLESECYHLDKMLYLYRYRDAFGNATFQRFQAIQDHLKLAQNQYADRYARKNAELLKQAERAQTTAPATKAGISFVVLDATGSKNAVNCLRSIKEYSPESEVILVENGVQSKARDKASIVVSSQANLGFAAGCNLGARSASRQFLCFMNDDAELVDKATVRNLLGTASKNIIAGPFSDKAKPPQGGFNKSTTPSTDMPVPMVVGLCMMLSKKLFDELGGFDTRFLTWEDDDLCRRGKLFMAPSMIVGRAFVHHKGHQTFETLKLDHFQVEKQNQQLYEKKHANLKVIAIAKNEENCVVDFFKQFEKITTDWYLLDTGSTDRTIEMAKLIGVKVESRPFVDFATTRNQALELFDPLKKSWVIMLDLDERLDKQTISAISELVFNHRSPSADFETYLAPLIAVNTDGSRREFVAKPFLFFNHGLAKWAFKVHEKWLAPGKYALVTNACLEHHISYHSGKRRTEADGLYQTLMAQEPYFQDPTFKAKILEQYPILDYDRPDDSRIAKIQAGPLVSSVIPTFKRPDLLKKAVQSALDQSYKTLEVLVIGDNCPDLEGVRTDVSLDPRVRVINLPANHGSGGAVPRNVGINLATGHYIAYLDDDNTWASDHVGNLLTTILREQTVWGWSSMRVNSQDLKFDRLERGRIDTSCVIHHRNLVTKHGPWKDRKEAGYAHDWEFFSRWREEPQTVTKYPSVNYNAETSGQPEFIANLARERSGEPSIRLSVLVPSLESRQEKRQRLLDQINQQCKDQPVEVLVQIDDGKMTVGDKRNLLIARAKGDYVVFIDDDDVVADSYIADILQALQENPDCVTFKGQIVSNPPEIFRFDMTYPHNTWEQNKDGIHMRCPSSLCPIRTSIAKSVKFPSISCAEDRIWGISLYPLLQTQVHIDKILYFYYASLEETEAQCAEKIAASRKIVDSFRYTPYRREYP
jgi:glycosyltransferase involved in cell wall biosynthesis